MGSTDYMQPLVAEIVPARASAAKLHVLQLAPIKKKLGAKWPKLSELVHKLFETTIREAQGPRDHFILLDELSYVVTFHGLALEEATLACVCIAQQVCEKLFGSTSTDISVRALVGQFSDDILASQFQDGSQISALLELNAREIVVSNNREAEIPATITRVTPGAQDSGWDPVSTIGKARDHLKPVGLEIGLFPIWDLLRNRSSCVYALPFSPYGGRKMGCTRQLMAGLSEQVVDTEIALLLAAHAYSYRVHQDHKVCATGTAVSYETLTNFTARIRYITALKSLLVCRDCPILLKIEEIPAGTPLGKLAELISMLAAPHVRFALQFQSPAAIPDKIDIRLGAAGIGIALPHACNPALAATFIRKLVQAFSEQKGFTFLEGLDTPELLAAARSGGVHFGTGQALGNACFSPTDPLASFPLAR